MDDLGGVGSEDFLGGLDHFPVLDWGLEHKVTAVAFIETSFSSWRRVSGTCSSVDSL